MALFIKDAEVSDLAERLARLRKVSKTEVVRLALREELARESAKPSLVDIGLDFCRKLNARGNRAGGKAADKAFRDSLYENG
jgi:antitoxin VapB